MFDILTKGVFFEKNACWEEKKAGKKRGGAKEGGGGQIESRYG